MIILFLTSRLSYERDANKIYYNVEYTINLLLETGVTMQIRQICMKHNKTVLNLAIVDVKQVPM